MKRITLTENNQHDITHQSIQALRRGDLVVFPSDTVYGLLVDAHNPKAVDTLIAFKDRPPGKAISVFVDGYEMIHEHAFMSQKQQQQLEVILPGCYTIVLDSKHTLDQRLESEKGTIGLRYIAYQPVQDLVQSFGSPITATSANLGGSSPHYSIDSFLNSLSQEKKAHIGLLVDAGTLPRRKPSTVVDYTSDRLEVLRMGDGEPSTQTWTSTSEDQTKQIAGEIMQMLVQKNTAKHIVCICSGDLGAGKTRFAAGVAEALGITEPVISPTFVITYSYLLPDSVPFHEFHHFDLYNITDASEFDHLGIDQLKSEPGIFCVEWGERLGSVYDAFTADSMVVHIQIEHDDESTRIIKLSSMS